MKIAIYRRFQMLINLKRYIERYIILAERYIIPAKQYILLF